MDPPASSSSSSSLLGTSNDARDGGHDVRAATKMTTTTSTTSTSTTTDPRRPPPPPAPLAPDRGGGSERQRHRRRSPCPRPRPRPSSSSFAQSSSFDRRRPRDAAKIIKGEIHNVLTVMRSDPRYYHTGNGEVEGRGNGNGNGKGGGGGGGRHRRREGSRFDYEERQRQSTTTSAGVKGGGGGGGGRFWGGGVSVNLADDDWRTTTTSESDVTGGTIISSHPILQGLRDLHDRLSVMGVEGCPPPPPSSTTMTTGAGGRVGGGGGGGGGGTGVDIRALDATAFVAPFAAAVRSADVDARTTGAALSALHKFIVYGFVGGYDDVVGGYDNFSTLGFPPSSSSSSSSYDDNIRESISLVARCIRRASFHSDASSSSSSATTRGKGGLSFWSSSDGRHMQRKGRPILGHRDDTDDEPGFELPSFLSRPRRGKRLQGQGSGGGGGAADSSRLMSYSSSSPSDEDVVLKLLSLSVQVLRCPAGRNLLPPGDVIGIFDTCLYVYIAAQETRRSLLRSAAADALGHCVIVVFGMRGGRPSKKPTRGHSADSVGPEDNVIDDRADDGDTDSDDDWGDRDPTEDIHSDDALLGGESVARSDSKQHRGLSQYGDDFSVPATDLDGHEIKTEGKPQEEEPALVAIMHRLASLADPLLHDDDTCQLGLGLVNIALETMSDVDDLSVGYPRLLNVMQNNLCRNLLRLSTSNDLICMGLTLRVIFNLFNGIKDHLKVQLEVFLTSVHLRILTPSVNPNSKERVWSSSPERRELALESLLEFCREPHLMADLYMNYDCDINCTNLFETICSTLAKVANPEYESVDQSIKEVEAQLNDENGVSEVWQKTGLNILNRLALEGLLAVIDGIARRCRASPKFNGSLPDHGILPHMDPTQSPPDSGNSAYLGDLVSLNNASSVDGSSSAKDPSEYDFCSVSTSSAFLYERSDSVMSDDVDWLSKARHHTSLALRERKIRKRRMAKAVVQFNERSKDKEWIEEGERLGILPTPATPSAIASFFYSTPNLDKAKVGLYLSKGPKEIHPFHAQVLKCFASLFDFRGMTFSDALRLFLDRFRLPGEAQCIDRLMEAFAVRLYEVQLSGTILDINQPVEKSMLDPPCRSNSDCGSRDLTGTLDPPAAADEVYPVLPFTSSDAAFIMSFSTIMLNTDLHNPNMKDEKRMTIEQFVRNNRGINDGADLPTEFLTSLYMDIKKNEIQVKQDMINDGADAFDGLMAKADVATPFFTSNHSAHHKPVLAGVHERDMYISISSASFNAISTLFVESWDDVLVTKALDGLRNSAYICSYFGLHEHFNRILETLLGFGLDYIGSVTSLMSSKPVCGNTGMQSPETKAQGNNQDDQKEVSDIDTELVSRNIPRLPANFLLTLTSDHVRNDNNLELIERTGSAAHRGLLSLYCALTLSKHHLSLVNEAWPTLLDVMFALRDVAALPPRLSDLDDFADSRGNPLPMSVFSNRSHHRVNEYTESIDVSDDSEHKSGFLSIFGFGRASSHRDKGSRVDTTQKRSPLTYVFQKVVHCANFDRIIMKTNDTAMAKRILTAMLDAMFSDGNVEEMISDPLYEHNSVFVLELAARLLISNRVHAGELYPIFFSKFQKLMNSSDASESAIIGLKFPYILERIVVTILRACIHLFDVPEVGLRGQLNRSLNLIATLPGSYTSAISDRIGCGAAIILRSRFYLFDDNTDDWSTIKCLLDLASQNKPGRGFVFDGIASVIDSIDYAVPSPNDAERFSTDENNNDVQLSKYGVEVMASLLLKFMNGSYEDDLSYKVPSMTYIRKVYSFSQHFSDKTHSDNLSASNNAHLHENEFEIMITAIYNDACLSQDETIAKKGFESLQGMVVSTRVDSLPVSKWCAFLQMVATNPPTIESQEARIGSLYLISRLFLTLMPELSNRKENWSELEDWTIRVASIVSENLRFGRATPLFETTVQTVTNVVNVMTMSEFNVGEGVNFCAWVGETLLFELEKVGACGGANSTIVASHEKNHN